METRRTIHDLGNGNCIRLQTSDLEGISQGKGQTIARADVLRSVDNGFCRVGPDRGA